MRPGPCFVALSRDVASELPCTLILSYRAAILRISVTRGNWVPASSLSFQGDFARRFLRHCLGRDVWSKLRGLLTFRRL